MAAAHARQTPCDACRGVRPGASAGRGHERFLSTQLGTQSTLCEYSEYPAQVHRLDEGTSGLMLVARTDAVRSVALEYPQSTLEYPRVPLECPQSALECP